MSQTVPTNLKAVLVLGVIMISGCQKSTEVNGGACWIDIINSMPAVSTTNVKRPGAVTVSGWALDDKAVTVPAEVSIELLSLDGKQRIAGKASRGTKRPDVAKVYNNSVFEDAGFSGKVDVNDIAVPGRYSIRVIQKGASSKLSCDTQKLVEVE